jgi:flagellar basal-body rod protein FlgB
MERQSMTTGLESSTIGVVALALDAASLRHQAIASNIANAETPGYRPLKVSFEEQLSAARAAVRQDGSVDADALKSLRPVLESEPLSAPGEAGSVVALDQQVAKLSENAVQYQALLRALNKQFSIIATAITEGKR